MDWIIGCLLRFLSTHTYSTECTTTKLYSLQQISLCHPSCTVPYLHTYCLEKLNRTAGNQRGLNQMWHSSVTVQWITNCSLELWQTTINNNPKSHCRTAVTCVIRCIYCYSRWIKCKMEKEQTPVDYSKFAFTEDYFKCHIQYTEWLNNIRLQWQQSRKSSLSHKCYSIWWYVYVVVIVYVYWEQWNGLWEKWRVHLTLTVTTSNVTWNDWTLITQWIP